MSPDLTVRDTQGYDASQAYDNSGFNGAQAYDPGFYQDDRHPRGGGGPYNKKRMVPSEPSPHVIFLGLDPDFTESDVSRVLPAVHAVCPLNTRHLPDAGIPHQQQLQRRVGHHNPRQNYRHLPLRTPLLSTAH